MLELFSGTGSVGKELKRIYLNDIEIVSLDIHPKYNPTIATDILKWNYTSLYSPHHFDIIWASPPCTEYSRAKTTGVRNLKLADSIVKKTLQIINYFQPTIWFIENPGTGAMLEKRSFMKKYEHLINRCTYCHYGADYKKPTNIWTNVKSGLHLRYCSKNDPCSYKKKHTTHKQTAQNSIWSQYKDSVPGTDINVVYSIPKKLIRHIFKNISLHAK